MVPHLVLVHGSRLSGAQWAPQLPLLERHASVGLPDLPGHGSRAGETFSLARSVEVVDEAVNAAPAGASVVLVGHSLGGYVAMAYAQHHADRLDGLVLAGCSATPKGLGAAVYRGVAALSDRLGPHRMTRINDRVLRTRYRADLIDPVIGGGYWFEPTTAAWNDVIDLCRPDMLAEVPCPVLFLNGQFDQFRFGVRDFLAQCPQAQVQILPRASHLANLDRPRAFGDALLRFTADVA
ncbi:MAG: alpha/beta hydrolase [Nocardioides sp.]|nr:alpha/beta hydrolase [Nocardioides sp.]